MIIDAHTHVFGPISEEERPKPPSIFHCHEFSGDLLVAEMDLAGVDKVFLISYDAQDIAPILEAKNESVEKAASFINKEYSLKALRNYPDRFIWFSTVSRAENGGLLERAKEDLEAGATGLKLMPSIMRVFPDDPCLMELYELCRQKNVPVIIDFSYWCLVGGSLRLSEDVRDFDQYIKRFCRVLQAFPEVNFQLAHFGTCIWTDRTGYAQVYEYHRLDPMIDTLRRFDNVYVDTAALTFLPDMNPGNRIGFDPLVLDHEYPFTLALKLLEYLVKGAGAEKVIFGTDWPYNEGICTYKQTVNMIRYFAYFLTDRQKELILGENALRFLKKMT
ncbi:MAG: amidohydrolase [Firmicutes bacterium]|nr:amidohydrolase [Bacillota bacterium]